MRIMAEEVWTDPRFHGSHIVSGFEFENVLLFLRAKLSSESQILPQMRGTSKAERNRGCR